MAEEPTAKEGAYRRLWWPAVRMLPSMVVGVGAVAAVTYYALGLRPAAAPGLPELVLRIDGEQLELPDGRHCPLAKGGCREALRALPASDVRVIAAPDTPFAYATPILAEAADAHRPAMLDDGTGPVRIWPKRGGDTTAWSKLDPDAPGMRVRIILKADGVWIAGAGGKVLGADPNGPTLLPGPQGLDAARLGRKLVAMRDQLQDVEEECAVLPALDRPFSEVVAAVSSAHGAFKSVYVAVP